MLLRIYFQKFARGIRNEKYEQNNKNKILRGDIKGFFNVKEP